MSKRVRVSLIWLAFLSFSLWLGQGAALKDPSKDLSIAKLKTSFVHRPYLYRLEKDGHTSFLLGTQHVGVSLSQFPAFVLEALQQSNVFAAEDLDNDGVAPRTSQVARFEKGLLTNTSQARLKERGLPIESFKAEDSILKLCMQYTFWEAHPEWAHLDKELESQAREMRKKLVGLDAAEDMTQVLANAARICEPNILTENVSPPQARANFLRTLEIYLRGEEASLAPNAQADEFMLLSVRNHHWIEKIVRVHAEGAFVAVGALHLGGPQGLLQKLSERGFRVSRLLEGSALRTAAVSR